MDYVLLAVVLIGACGGAFMLFRSPDFYIGLVKAMIPSLLIALKGRPFTEEEKQAVREGRDPFDKREWRSK